MLPLKSFNGLLFRVTIKDEYLVEIHPEDYKRVIYGRFLAVDCDGNILLTDSMEDIGGAKGTLRRRYLGMLSVPKNTIESVEVEKMKYERYSQWV